MQADRGAVSQLLLLKLRTCGSFDPACLLVLTNRHRRLHGAVKARGGKYNRNFFIDVL